MAVVKSYSTMMWTLILCVQVVFAVDQRTQDYYKTMKEKFMQDTLNEFEALLKQEYTELKTERETPVEFDESPGLENEYMILNNLDIWSRMSSWTRPDISSNAPTRTASEETERIERQQPASLRDIHFGRTTVKIYKNSNNNTMVLSWRVRTDAQFPNFQLFVKVYMTYIKLLPGMCGKGMCLVVERNGADSLLIFTADLTSVSGYLEIFMFTSQTDILSLKINEVASHTNDTLLTYHFPEFRVHHDDDDRVIIDPQDTEFTLNTNINVDTTNLVNATDRLFPEPYSFFEPASHDVSDIVHSDVNYTVNEGRYHSEVRYTPTSDKLQDGVVTVAHPAMIAPNLFLVIRKRYIVYPKGQEDSSYFLDSAIEGSSQGHFEANSPQAFSFAIYGAPSDISIRKVFKDGDNSLEFPGFDFLITRYIEGVVSLVLTSYSLQPEDAGAYQIAASFENGQYLTHTFKIIIVNKKIVISNFSKTEMYSIDGNKQPNIELSCTASGDPTPSIDFVNPVSDNTTLSQFRQVQLENNATFEMMATEVNEDSISRSMIVHKLPDSFIYPYQIGCKAYSEMNEELQILYIYETDFDEY